MAPSRLVTLGGFAFNVNGQWTRGPATRKARALMAFLILNRDADVSREALLDHFWEGADLEHARASLKTALWSIRRCLASAGVDADEFMLTTKSVVRWRADTSVDASEFARLAARDDAAGGREALQLYRGDFLEGDFDDWTIMERERLAALYEKVLARVAKSAKDAGAAQRFIARNPYDEEMYVTLIESDLAAGRRGSAASWVERCRKALAEIGEKPSPAFEARFGKIGRADFPPRADVSLPFAGREHELAFLSARFSDAARRHGTVTLLHGEAGIGKSSLLDRAARIASDYALKVLAVRCDSDTANPFEPWPDLFIALTGADFDVFVEKHAGDVATAVAAAIVERFTEQTVLIVDDAHQLSAEAFDIFVALAKSATNRHAVIAAARPEGVARIRTSLNDIVFEELAVAALELSSLEWALAHALAGEHPDVLDILYKRSGGHPLFFAGLLSSLVSTGVLARHNDHWQLTKAIDTDLELPDTLKRFIETRLQTRGDAPRAVACALALEPRATADDLVSVLGMQEAAVLDAIDDLLALGLISQPETGSPFAFSHDLIREVAAVGLNSGRRAVLHRAYAERLGLSRELDASLRRARHLYATGEFLSAAECYLTSAREALESNAVQDAIERCNSGIDAAEKLEPTTARDVLIALRITSSRAALASGGADEAIAQAREAVSLARVAGDSHKLAEATLALAMTEGAAHHIAEQRSDAAEAVELAKTNGDRVLECHALVSYGSAARELGLRGEASRSCSTAHDIALECAQAELAQVALEELTRGQITWWMFAEARNSTRIGLDAARRGEPLAEAAFLQLRSALCYLLERFEQAQSDVQAALRIAEQSVRRRQGLLATVMHPRLSLQFACYYMAGKIAVARKRWDEALAAVERAAALRNIAKLPRHSQSLTLLHIDTLLQRNDVGDDATAHLLAMSLRETSAPPGLLGWSDCVELAHARDSTRMRGPRADVLLRRALNVLEENAHHALLDTDRAFGNLAEAAFEIGEGVLANRAQARSKYYRSMRMSAAGADWGGKIEDSGDITTGVSRPKISY